MAGSESTYRIIRVLSFISNFFRSSRLPKLLHAGKENWALVTGASDGIGFGFAEELASRGFHIILHGRNEQKLKGCQERLSKNYPQAKTRLYVADATQPFSVELLNAAVEGTHLTLLVNNVGGFPLNDFPLAQDYTSEQIDMLINLNVGFTTKIDRELLPTLIKNEPSAILNISSLASYGMLFIPQQNND
jgi:17beta-estradiol 17-dehydrogenase / very-long-chain 3-oxoacyl-CoA reductase